LCGVEEDLDEWESVWSAEGLVWVAKAVKNDQIGSESECSVDEDGEDHCSRHVE